MVAPKINQHGAGTGEFLDHFRCSGLDPADQQSQVSSSVRRTCRAAVPHTHGVAGCVVCRLTDSDPEDEPQVSIGCRSCPFCAASWSLGLT